ncbi:MAG: NADP-dependent oxidoreductase [Chloroflexota bacterium]
MHNRSWVLAKRPQGVFQQDDVDLQDVPLSAIGDGQVLVRSIYFSIDPAYRVWMDEDAVPYLPPRPLGDQLWGSVVGVIEESHHPSFEKGDVVAGILRLAEYNLSDGNDIAKIPPGFPLDKYYALYGHIGTTAYFGVELLNPQKDETLVVSSAAGGVGSIAVQIGNIYGCRVVGIAGSDERCRWLTEDLGLAAAINYKTQNLDEQLHATCPDGVDAYFDNVGGSTLDTILLHANKGARIALSGMVSTYNTTQNRESSAIYQLMQAVHKSITIYGYIVLNYLDRYPEAFAQIHDWVETGKIKVGLTVVDGIEQVPQVIDNLLNSHYLGKVVVRVSEEPTQSVNQ